MLWFLILSSPPHTSSVRTTNSMLFTYSPEIFFKVGDRNNSFEDYLSDLHQKDGEAEDCRYGLYDYEYKYNPDGAESTFKSKIFLMSWCPDSSRIKKKMLYSSRFDNNLLKVCPFYIYRVLGEY